MPNNTTPTNKITLIVGPQASGKTTKAKEIIGDRKVQGCTGYGLPSDIDEDTEVLHIDDCPSEVAYIASHISIIDTKADTPRPFIDVVACMESIDPQFLEALGKNERVTIIYTKRN